MSHPTYYEKIQVAVTTGNGTAVRTNGRAAHHVVYVEFSAGVSAGVVTIEEASDGAFAGTWSKIADVAFVANAAVAVHFYGCHLAVRARISTNIVGGTVTVHYGSMAD